MPDILEIAAQTLSLPNQRPADGALVLCVHDVIGRLHSASCVPILPVTHLNWVPAPQRCHDNVAHWVGLFPECAAVHGWLYMDLGFICAQFGVPRLIDLLPHTVVRRGDQQLVDITPRHADASSDLYPFIPHPGPDEEYAAFVDGLSICRVRIYADETPPRIVDAPN
jgi:hypothetical protein